MSLKSLALLTFLIVTTLACNHPPVGKGNGEVETSTLAAVSFRVEKVVGGLEPNTARVDSTVHGVETKLIS